MPKITLSAQDIQDYQDKKVRQSDLAISYGVGRTTIRRALKEAGLCTYNGHISSKEKSLLEVLKTFNIDSAQKLSQLLQRGKLNAGNQP